MVNTQGEIDKGESVIECAKREFNEETGLTVDNRLTYLGSHKVSHRKLVIIFIVEQELDNSNFKSNFFEKEHPKGSGVIKSFPEMDKAEWIELNHAKKIINPKQLPFLEKLERYIKKMPK